MSVVGRPFYGRDAMAVAPDLLNKLLVVGERSGRIVEVEAYRGSEDAGSHSFRGRTDRNASMFGPPGHLYVYRSYGMHWCANVVCSDEGTAHAVLIRALVPVAGVAAMRAARAASAGAGVLDRDLCRGPGRLCQALGITGDLDGTDLVGPSAPVRIMDDGRRPPDTPGESVRVGLTRGADHPWRYFVRGERHLSRPG